MSTLVDVVDGETELLEELYALPHDVDGGGELEGLQFVGDDANPLEVIGDDDAETSRSLRPWTTPQVTVGRSYLGRLELGWRWVENGEERSLDKSLVSLVKVRREDDDSVIWGYWGKETDETWRGRMKQIRRAAVW
ncbi:hypothetical protein MLD38_033966 [Melastoma candidum]|uniref:Uncharacterized protein n=1 Tax=Melastoma candidum TaxID=119954 RepID=A0ACB9M838_9MYRT|nr:hypothetical protein MLD38_033966 [Melastoma candidum]